jgi:tRNA (guanine37-N1)-methyltransferase
MRFEQLSIGYCQLVLKIGFVTLFPDMVLDALSHSILGRAQQAGLLSFLTTNPRDFTYDSHRTVDDTPYGGGSGMVMRPDPVAHAIKYLLDEIEPLTDPSRVAIVLTDPFGRKFDQTSARELVDFEAIIFVCGHYEGIDDRIRQLYATHVFTIGDFILTGGELPALVMADAVSRLVPGVLGSAGSLAQDSHQDGLLSSPQYTRPETFDGHRVPDVLLSGNHKAIAKWKRQVSLEMTKRNRPDLFARSNLAKGDSDLLF